MNLKKPIRSVEILLVEDNKADIRLISEFFKDDHMVYHNMHVVNNGIEALKFLRKEDQYHDAVTPDIMLMDLFMPKMDGFELIKNIRNDENFKGLVVGVMTANDSDVNILNLDDESFPTFYVPKPVDVDKFLELMHRAEGYLNSDLRIISLE